MAERTDQPGQQPSPETQPVPHHWIMTIQTSDGRQGTSDGTITLVPGTHTEASAYAHVLGEMKQWIGSENTTVLFYRLTPDALPSPAVTR